MKRRIIVCVVAIMLCLCLPAYAAGALKLEQTGTVRLALGDALKINILSQPGGETVSFASSNTLVAKVTKIGQVNPVKEGTATITARSSKGQTASFQVKVYDPKKPTKLTLKQTGSIKVNLGETATLEHSVSPYTADAPVKYTSSNAAVASVNASGVISARKEGTVTVTVQSKKNAALKTTVKVTVVDPKKPRKLTLKQTGTIRVDLGDTVVLEPVVSPSTANAAVKYTSSNTAVASVSGSGVITPKKEGTVRVTAQSKRNSALKATVKVKVVDPRKPSKFALKQTGTIKVNLGATATLESVASPATADASAKYTSSDTSVASVSGSGVVTPKKEGTVTITAQSKRNSALKATVKVKVVDPRKPSKFALKQTGTIKVNLGATATLESVASPATADASAKFTSSNTAVASVSGSGVITPKKEGTVTITAQSKRNSALKATVKVTVVDPKKPTGVALSPSGTVRLELGEELTLTYALKPYTAESGVKFSSSNAKAVKVNQEGKVLAAAEGTATVTVTTNRQGKTASVKVTVYDPKKPTSLKISGAHNVTLGVYDALQLGTVVTPSDANAKTAWKSSNTAVATVASGGKVTGLSAGSAVITATCGEHKDSIKVTVISGNLPKTLAIDGASAITLEIGKRAALTATLSPEGAVGAVSWESTNSAVASVDGNGRVTARRAGSAAIVARCNRNGLTAYVKVTVPQDPAKPEPALPLAGLKIGIDPGHQAKQNTATEPIAPGSSVKKVKCTSGTAGVYTRVAEYVVNLQVGLKLRDYLTALGAEVYMTRTGHYVDISNIQRAKMMNEAGVDLVLRLHCDGSTNSSDSGVNLYTPASGAVGGVSTASKKAADLMLPAMKAATGVTQGSVHVSSSYTGLNWSEVPCILVEMGFMSNYVDDARLVTDDYQNKLVEGMANGIAAYFGK